MLPATRLLKFFFRRSWFLPRHRIRVCHSPLRTSHRPSVPMSCSWEFNSIGEITLIFPLTQICCTLSGPCRNLNIVLCCKPHRSLLECFPIQTPLLRLTKPETSLRQRGAPENYTSVRMLRIYLLRQWLRWINHQHYALGPLMRRKICPVILRTLSQWERTFLFSVRLQCLSPGLKCTPHVGLQVTSTFACHILPEGCFP